MQLDIHSTSHLNRIETIITLFIATPNYDNTRITRVPNGSWNCFMESILSNYDFIIVTNRHLQLTVGTNWNMIKFTVNEVTHLPEPIC